MAAQVRDLEALDKIIADDPSGIASFQTAQNIAKATRRNVPIQGAGIQLTYKPDGVQIDASAVIAATAGNFIPTWDGETGLIVVSPGTFQAITPNIDGAPIDTPVDGVFPSLAYDGDGTFIGWLHISATLSAAHDYVVAYVWADVVLDGGDTLPDDDPAAGEYYIPLFMFVDGVQTAQYVSTSLTGHIDDDGTSSSQGIIDWDEA